MNYKVEKAVLDSGVKIIFAVVEGVDNHGNDKEWQAYRTKRIAELYDEYKDLDIHSDPISLAALLLCLRSRDCL